MTSGRFLYSILFGSTVNTCCVSLRTLFAWTSSLSSLSWCRGGFPRSCCSADHSSSPVAVHGQGDRCFCAGPAGRAQLWETFEIPQCSSSYSCLDPVVDIPFVAQMQIPLVRLPSRFSSCSTFIRWSTLLLQVQQFSSAHVEETAELPQLRRFAWTLALHMPVDGFRRPCVHAET